MSFANIDDKILDCPKALDAGEDATDLFIRSIIWCNSHLTDGRIPKAGLSRLTGKPNRDDLAAILVRVGWWEDHTDHWQIHDYLDWNDSREEVEERRKAAAERTAKWRKGRRARGVTHHTPVTSREGDASVTALVTPPSPLLSSDLDPPLPPAVAGGDGGGKRKRKREKQEPPPELNVLADEIERHTGIRYPPSAFEGLRERLREHSLDDLLAYVRWAAADEWLGTRVQLKPSVLLRKARCAEGVAAARAAPRAPARREPEADGYRFFPDEVA